MTETESISEKETKLKKIGWSLTPRFARQAFILSIILIIESIVLLFTFAVFANVFYTIPLTIMLSVAIIVGIIGTTPGSLSLKEKKTIFGILGVIFNIIAVLWNAIALFILHCDAWFSIPN